MVIFIPSFSMMTNSEALTQLNLPQDFKKEMLRMKYHERFIETFRNKSASLTIEEVKKLEKQLDDLTNAYCTLQNWKDTSEKRLLFEFDHSIDSDKSEPENGIGTEGFDEFIEHILKYKKYGLAVSLLEIGISNTLNSDSSINIKPLPNSIRLLGKTLIELGLISQGIEYLNYGQNNYNKALAYHRIGEYRLSAHYFAKELRLRETNVPIDEICQRISICYFLLGDYQNAINIIEEVLPKLLPKKSIFEESCKSKNFATSIMVSMYKLNKVSGKKFEQLKVWINYPLCLKYLQNCYGKLSRAFDVIVDFEENSKNYEDFLNSLKPKPFIKKDIILTYELEEIEECYSDFFNGPMNKSLIYHPR